MVYSLIIGALAGFIAGKIMKGGGFGLLINIILGIVGGIVGAWLFSTMNISLGEGIIGDLATSSIGAITILFVASFLNKN